MKKFLAVAAITTAFATGLAMGSAAAHAQNPTSAQESPAKATGIEGKWHFVLDTEGGVRPVDCEFAVDSNGKVTGTFDKTAVAGTDFNRKLDLAFEFKSEEANETAQMMLKGTLDDTGKITGNWQFADYDGAFTASRPE